jgi:hypothetical protein
MVKPDFEQFRPTAQQRAQEMRSRMNANDQRKQAMLMSLLAQGAGGVIGGVAGAALPGVGPLAGAQAGMGMGSTIGQGITGVANADAEQKEDSALDRELRRRALQEAMRGVR